MTMGHVRSGKATNDNLPSIWRIEYPMKIWEPHNTKELTRRQIIRLVSVSGVFAGVTSLLGCDMINWLASEDPQEKQRRKAAVAIRDAQYELEQLFWKMLSLEKPISRVQAYELRTSIKQIDQLVLESLCPLNKDELVHLVPHERQFLLSALQAHDSSLISCETQTSGQHQQEDSLDPVDLMLQVDASELDIIKCATDVASLVLVALLGQGAAVILLTSEVVRNLLMDIINCALKGDLECASNSVSELIRQVTEGSLLSDLLKDPVLPAILLELSRRLVPFVGFPRLIIDALLILAFRWDLYARDCGLK